MKNTGIKEAELEQFMLDKHFEIMNTIKSIEQKFQDMWDDGISGEEDVDYDEVESYDFPCGIELSEAYGKLSINLELMERFNLDKGTLKYWTFHSRVGGTSGTCYVENYKVKTDTLRTV